MGGFDRDNYCKCKQTLKCIFYLGCNNKSTTNQSLLYKCSSSNLDCVDSTVCCRRIIEENGCLPNNLDDGLDKAGPIVLEKVNNVAILQCC